MRNACLFSAAPLCVLGALLGGCAKGPEKDERPTFAFVINVSEGRFWDLALAGVKTAAEEEGVNYDFRIPGQSTAAQQKQIVEALISMGIQGMAISPLNPQSTGRLLDVAAEYFPVICQDSDAPDSKRICYIGTDNVAAGRAAGQELARALPGGGQIAVFVGKLDVGNAMERYQGVLEGIEGTNLQLVEEPFTDQADRPTAIANVTGVMAKYPNLVGIVGLWGYNGPAAVMAMKDNPGRDIKIVAFDEDIETVNAVRNGQIVCTIVQQPYEFGYQSIKMLAKLYRGEPVDIPESETIHVPHKVITKENVETFERDINEKLATLDRYTPQSAK